MRQFSSVRSLGRTGHVTVEECVQALKTHRPKIVVIDDPVVRSDLVLASSEGNSLVVLADTGRERLDDRVDVTWNFLIGASHDQYPNSRVGLLGLTYFPLRASLKDSARRRPLEIRHLLVTLGGSDVYRRSGEIERIVRGIDSSIAVRVHPNQELSQGGSIHDISDDFYWADAVVCAGGLTKYEAVSLSIPTAVLNQTDTESADSATFAKEGLVIDLGEAGSVSSAQLKDALTSFIRDNGLRQNLTRQCEELSLQDGAGRVVHSILSLAEDR